MVRAYRSGCKVRNEDHDLLAWRALQIAPEQYRTLDRLVLGAYRRTGRVTRARIAPMVEPDECRDGEQHGP